MRTIRIYMETPYAGLHPTEDFEVEDDATQEEIAAEAKETFFNSFSYGYEEIEIEIEGDNQ